ncbi:MAG TPA: hypothetical protein VFS00_08900, partial [Polyangiaceae bacterium]|nr:hypothetical protein [Polyangiaceae bacterium]
MANPIEKFLAREPDAEPKEAGWGGFAARNAAGALGAGAASLGGSIGESVIKGIGGSIAAGTVAGVGMAATRMYQAATKARDFRAMLEHNPDLVDSHRQDEKRFNQLYSSLRTMNPHFAADPIVAGVFMRRMVDSPMGAAGVLTEALGQRDRLPSALGRATDEGVSVAK